MTKIDDPLTLEEKEHYLTKTVFSREDVKRLTGYRSNSKAYQVMEYCRTELGGHIGGIRGRHFIRASSLWAYLGTTQEEELRLLSIVKGTRESPEAMAFASMLKLLSKQA